MAPKFSRELPCSTPATEKTDKRGKKVLVYQQLNKTNKKALDDIVHFLKTNHEVILQTKAQLENGDIANDAGLSPQKAAKKAERFHETYQHFDRLPLYWIADFFVSGLGMSRDLVDRAENCRSHQLREMLEYFTGVSGTDTWPPILKDKVVLLQWLQWLAHELGDRHKNFERFATDTGSITWSAATPFKFEWDTTRGTPRIVRMQATVGPVVPLKRHIIDKSFDMTIAWSDMRARFVTEDEEDQQPPPISTMFPKDAPFKKLFSKEWRLSKATELANKRTREQEALQVGENVVCTLSKKRKADQLAASLASRTPPTKMKTPLWLE